MKQFKDLETLVKISNNKNIISGVKSVIGLNTKNIKKIILLNGLSKIPRVKEIDNDYFFKIKSQVNFFNSLEDNKILFNVLRYKKIKNYRGIRHLLKLPVRGQRTHTNSKTARINVKK